MKRVVAFGTFDILHPGHIAFLEAARRLGTHLTVVVARDATVRREKGRLPVFNERDRLAVVRSLRCADRALLGDRPGKWRVLRRIRPDVVAIGFDQNEQHDAIKMVGKAGIHFYAIAKKCIPSNFKKIKLVRLPRFSPHKSSMILPSLRA